MNLSIALGADALPADEEALPERRKQRWGGALAQKKRQTNDFAHLYQHEKPFRPDWADQKPGSTPKLPLNPPGGRP